MQVIWGLRVTDAPASVAYEKTLEVSSFEYACEMAKTESRYMLYATVEVVALEDVGDVVHAVYRNGFRRS